MRIVLVTWKLAENDPFSFFNNCLAKHINAHGHEAIHIAYDQNFAQNLRIAAQSGIDFAISWQGLSSTDRSQNSQQLIWEELRIPLVCLHGDHPCHDPENHAGMPKALIHIYGAQSFANFANRVLRREVPAKSNVHFNFMHDNITLADRFTGDFFVLPKNVDDSAATIKFWEEQFAKPIYTAFCAMKESITEEFESGNKIDHHTIIDRSLTPALIQLVHQRVPQLPEYKIGTLIHALLDKVYRNLICEHILVELADVKLKIVGRGWDRFAAMNNKNHQFFQIGKVEDANAQFYSNYGIIDVTPVNDSLHDRTFRALANKNGFLCGSSWPYQEYFPGHDFSNLFFSGRKGELREKAEKVIQSPNAHRELAAQFNSAHDARFNFTSFFEDITESVRTSKMRMSANT